MIALVRWILIACLVCLYVFGLYAVIHPRVSEDYKSYYIDHTSPQWDPVHYHSTPEQGIDFGRAGLPDWVDGMFGIAAPEPWGRWTDGSLGHVAGMQFTRTFSGPLCVVFTATATPQIGRTFQMKFGDESRTVQAMPQPVAHYDVQFDNVKNAARLEFLLPKDLPRENELDRHSGDPRRIGLGLYNLKMLPGQCPAAP